MRCHLPETLPLSRAGHTRAVAAGFMALSLMLAPLALQAQTPATPPVSTAPASTAPAPTAPASPAAPAPAAPDAAQPQAPDATAPAQPAPDLQSEVQAPPLPDLTGVATLVPMLKDPPEAQEVEIPAKPVVILSGQGKWEENFATLSDAFKKINAALDKAGKKPAGRPIIVYTKYTDEGFSYDAMIPLSEAPAADATPPGDGMRYGVVPAGKALRFVHADAYSEISDTYDAAGLYVEMRDLVSKEMQIEEWVTDITDPAAKSAVVNLYIELQDKPAAKEPPKNP